MYCIYTVGNALQESLESCSIHMNTQVPRTKGDNQRPKTIRVIPYGYMYHQSGSFILQTRQLDSIYSPFLSLSLFLYPSVLSPALFPALLTFSLSQFLILRNCFNFPIFNTLLYQKLPFLGLRNSQGSPVSF